MVVIQGLVGESPGRKIWW